MPSAADALDDELDAHDEDDEHEDAHYPGASHLPGETRADLSSGYEADAREYECGKPLDVTDDGVSGCARCGVEGQGEDGCGDRDLHRESEGIDEYGSAQEAAAYAEEAGYEAEHEVDEDSPAFVQTVAIGLAGLGGNAAAAKCLGVNEAAPPASGARQARMPPGVELLSGQAQCEDDQNQAECGVVDARQSGERLLEDEGRNDRTGNGGSCEEICAPLVHDTHIAIGKRAGYAVGGDKREDGAGDDGRLYVREEDAQDGYEDEAAARADENAEDARYESDGSECQPFDCLLPSDSRQPFNYGAGEPVQPGHLTHRALKTLVVKHIASITKTFPIEIYSTLICVQTWSLWFDGLVMAPRLLSHIGAHSAHFRVKSDPLEVEHSNPVGGVAVGHSHAGEWQAVDFELNAPPFNFKEVEFS